MKFTSALSASFVALTAAAPHKRQVAEDLCGQWDLVEEGPFTIYNNLWGQDNADSGSQCITVDSVSGNSVTWSASWTWVGGEGQVKSYPNVVINTDAIQLSEISSIPTTYDWSYSGDGLIANVAYDFFTSSSAGGDEEYEIMIWLGALGGAGPISENYNAEGNSVPIASADIAGTTWNLYKGPNGQMTVLSFVPADGSQINSFDADANDFVSYLIDNGNIPASQYAISFGAGTEPFEGENAEFTVSEYSIEVN